MGTLYDAFGRIVQEERFHRLCDAFDAACRWELPRTTALLGNRLLEMGAWIDGAGDWRYDTRPTQPLPPDLGANQDADWEL